MEVLPSAPGLVSFLTMVLLIEATPGPNMAYLAALTLAEGRRAGLQAVIGIALGLALIGTAAALGLAELLARSPLAWSLLRWAGVAYLLWLAWQGWRRAGNTDPGRAADTERSQDRYLLRGLTTNLLNPKAAIFYVVMLPEFVDAAAPALPQILTLTALSIAVASIIHLTIITLAGQAHRFLSSPKRARTARRVLAIGLVVVALWFAATTRQPVAIDGPPPAAASSS